MVHEKIFKVGVAREVKVIVKGFPSKDLKRVSKFFEIRVKEAGQALFQNPTGISLPVPQQIHKPDQKQLAGKVIALSGISETHIQVTVREFDRILESSVLW
ncbi:hypothetical protein GCM10007423_12010 [Dyadobacter endophyticus]|uniref:Uncharacterized protein n=1 Tax=Dyadobacter endophyticus TaxID=1749036 RepID=A0ABQ1YII7_9BACT|nr:hypothetical protein [Dyadobacter endophyticus]GGH26772.1 hypothetical protein GCM10007423_12010 [Dyadobacter endophyticus]